MKDNYGFARTNVGATGHVVVAGRVTEDKPHPDKMPDAAATTPTATIPNLFPIPYTDKSQRITYLRNCLDMLNNLTALVEQALYEEEQG